MRRALLIAASVFALVPLAPVQAREEIPAEGRYGPFSANLETCESPGILSTIQGRFARNERSYWNSSAEIIAFERVHQTGLRHNGLDLIPRRTCEAVAVMGDRKRVRVVYSIIEANGFAGYGTGVTFCVTGYDRTLAHGSACDRLPDR